MRYIPKAIAAILLWGLVAYIILNVNPVSVRDVGVKNAYLPLLVPVFLATSYSVYAVISSVWASLAASSLVILMLVLGIMGILNIFLAIVIMAMIVFTIYLRYYSS